MKRIVFFPSLSLLVIFTGCSIQDTQTNGYAVVIGISRYISTLPEGSSPNLTYTDDDALGIAELLEAKGYEVTLLVNENGTKENLTSEITRVAAEMGPDDTFLLYFAGHGVQSDFPGLPESGREGGAEDVFDEWLILFGSVQLDGYSITMDPALSVSDDELKEIISVIPSRRKIVLIDACNSGGFIGQGVEADSIPQTYGTTYDTRSPFSRTLSLYFRFPDIQSRDIPPDVAVVFSASGETEFSWENGILGHGIFTYYFLESGYEGDSDQDGYITLTESYAFVADKIRTDWNNFVAPDVEFHPHISGGPVDFVLYPAD